MVHRRWDDDEEDEDFENEPEDFGGDDDDGTVECPYCGEAMFDDVEQCPHCGKYLSDEDAPRRRWPWWMWLGLAGALFVVWRWVVG
jgi:predicted nucleic acid-binding Zn ribbon protein